MSERPHTTRPPFVLTALDLARQRWEQAGWGEPRDNAQARLWSLFWTGLEPKTERPYVTWTRPLPWVEELVRS